MTPQNDRTVNSEIPMPVISRDYQDLFTAGIYGAWDAGAQNVCGVMPTGAGKTTVFSGILRKHPGVSVAIAHRKELVGQMALALARQEVPHRIIGPPSLVRMIVAEQMRECGRTWYSHNARCAVAGVNTLVNRAEKLTAWAQQVTLWVQDEGHHVLQGNVWGKAAAMFPNARGLGVTATPLRADGKGLGRDSHGLYDRLVEGPSMRWLIQQGYLTDYEIYCPETKLDLTAADVSASTGDYKQPALRRAAHASAIVGDVVEHYKRIAPGKLGVVFATDVETATDIARKFQTSGVRAEVVSAETPDLVRNEIVRRFRNRQLHVLVNVDLFGEGFDLPAIEIVQFARPTMSYGLFVQQFGRALRPLWGGTIPTDAAGRLADIAGGPKPRAIICDHVGNVIKHGLPDAPRQWSLAARASGSRADRDPDALLLRPCRGCTRPYPAFRDSCPYCGHTPEPAGRSSAQQVEGNLILLDPEVLARMRGEVASVDDSANTVAQRMKHAGAPPVAINGYVKQHGVRQEMQGALRQSIAWYAGRLRDLGHSDAEIYRRFYLTFDIDILSAQALGRPEALALADRVNLSLGGLMQ